MIRFTRANWERFNNGKLTTIRFYPVKDGEHAAYCGSRMKPVKLGKVKLLFQSQLPARNLSNSDAIMDGFESWKELFFELGRLNPKHSLDGQVYIYRCVVLEREPK